MLTGALQEGAQTKAHNLSSNHQLDSFRPGRNTSKPRLLGVEREESIRLLVNRSLGASTRK